LQLAGKIDTVIFDKTGTLTFGRPSVTNIVPTDALSAEELLRLAASVEKGSEHPLSQAVIEEAAKHSVKLSEPKAFEAFAGKGVRGEVDGRLVLVGNRRFIAENGGEFSAFESKLALLEGEGKTTMIVMVDGGVVGLLAVADTVKPSAKPLVDTLKKMGVRVIMLTGDNERTASAIAKRIGIDEYMAEVLPQQKEAIIESLQKEGRVVAMVGDGINDAPALAKADIGIAIGGGTDIAKETGGIVLIRDDLLSVATAIRLSKKTLSKIKQNLFWAFAYNVVLIPIAAGALVPVFGVQIYNVLPFLAAGAMAFSSVTVISNSLLLFRFAPIRQ
jgi:Cu+-exporting ATPase